jgi:hypothetical protein
MEDIQVEAIEGWAYLEIMGHSKIAGRISTKKLGVSVMFQIDVPKGETEFSHTEFYSPSAIFSIKPTTEEWCRKYTEAMKKYYHEILPYIPETRQLPEKPTDDIPERPDVESDDPLFPSESEIDDDE